MTRQAPPPMAARLASARSPDVDALRGFALLGVIAVNAPFFAYSLSAPPPVTSALDPLALWFVGSFATGKFFLIFSFLFGFGFAVLLGRSEGAGALAGGVGVDFSYFRRLGGLLVLGAAHAVFLFFGDILVLYAVLGLVLWLLRRRSDRVLLGLAGTAMLLGLVTQTAVLTADFSELAAPVGATGAGSAGYLGGFREVTAQRLMDLPVAATVVALFNGPSAFAMFVLGFVATRRAWFPWPEAERARMRTRGLVALLAGGLGSGVAGYLVVGPAAASGSSKLVGAVALSLLAPLLSFALVVAVVEFARRVPDARSVRALELLGRNSLSGYLLHSVILGWIFLGWGFGLYGRLGPAAVLLVSLGTFVLLIALLGMWTHWFRYGPGEWVLRSFTDLRWKALLVRRPVVGSGADLAANS